MSVSDEQSWPLTPEGLTDWEVAFEDPDKGFIALITQANTPAALRQCTIVVIEKLCARHNDPAEVERFKSGLIQLVPDDTPDEDLLRITGAVTVILRQIKDDRILKAVEYAKDREQGRSTGGRRAEDKKKPTSQRSPLRSPLAWGLVAGAIAASVAGYFIFAGSGPQEKLKPNLVLIEQMKNVALGKVLKTHTFEGALRTGTRAGRAYVTAEAIPTGACVSAAWVFVNRGNISINGVTPQKISPSILSKLCAMRGESAILTWFPKREKPKSP